MTIRHSLILLALMIYFLSGGACFAGDWDLLNATPRALDLMQGTCDARDYETMVLSGTSLGEKNTAKGSSPAPGLTAGQLHRYLGYATVLLAGVAAVSSGNKSVHWTAAYGTAGAAALTVTTGTLAHGHRFSLEDGLFTEDNLHILLGTIGAVGCIAAVAMADSDGGGSHASAGVVGGAAMALSVVTIRW